MKPKRVMNIELCCCTDTLLMEIGEKQAKQKDIAITYGMAIRSTEKQTGKK
jgi:hypothetical protein